MGFFNRKKATDSQNVETSTPAPIAAAPVQTSTPAPVNLGKQTGGINLTKGSKVTIEKTPVIVAKATWDSSTDYDLYALVLTKDGRVHTVSTFGTENDSSYQTSILGGAVKHLGDVGRESAGQAEETIEIRMTPDIVAVVPVAYSAQSNGTGSFRKYKVSMSIDNKAGTSVSISAANADKNNNVYSVAIGVITNTDAGVDIEALESYSRPSSENRPALNSDGSVTMDAGPKNAYK